MSKISSSMAEMLEISSAEMQLLTSATLTAMASKILSSVLIRPMGLITAALMLGKFISFSVIRIFLPQSISPPQLQT